MTKMLEVYAVGVLAASFLCGFSDLAIEDFLIPALLWPIVLPVGIMMMLGALARKVLGIR